MTNGNLVITEDTRVSIPLRLMWTATAIVAGLAIGGAVWATQVNYRLGAIEKHLQELEPARRAYPGEAGG